MMKTIIFMGSKPIGFDALSFLIEKQIEYSIQILAVFTNDNKRFDSSKSVKELAISKNISVFDDLSYLENLPNVDIIICVQYHQILKEHHIKKAKQIAINLHMAPLPEYRGCNQFSFAILNGDKEFGTTIHKIDLGIDSGDILFEKRFEIPPKCYVKDLYDITYQKSIELFKEKIFEIIDGRYEFIPQSSINKVPKTYYRKDIENIKKINWDEWSKEKIELHIRATGMPGFEPPYAIIAGKKVKFVVE
ncbi:MAG: hypothetical protein NZM44_05600 [Candidatus Calescibacterium sp.]|nr:hypothetical protein [Candidatus Calescibacterium sp.]